MRLANLPCAHSIGLAGMKQCSRVKLDGFCREGTSPSTWPTTAKGQRRSMVTYALVASQKLGSFRTTVSCFLVTKLGLNGLTMPWVPGTIREAGAWTRSAGQNAQKGNTLINHFRCVILRCAIEGPPVNSLQIPRDGIAHYRAQKRRGRQRCRQR
jgi:hypothetical protein